MKKNLVMLLGMIVFSSLILASVISARHVWAAKDPPWTTDNYDGLWHNTDFTSARGGLTRIMGEAA
ncbi:hypothetical protein MUP00_10010 [Candidatus Bathyarchaeota archaeon]|nr:hypothetical protein [Candidatus Bathyarchaeota archaeon]